MVELGENASTRKPSMLNFGRGEGISPQDLVDSRFDQDTHTQNLLAEWAAEAHREYIDATRAYDFSLMGTTLPPEYNDKELALLAKTVGNIIDNKLPYDEDAGVFDYDSHWFYRQSAPVGYLCTNRALGVVCLLRQMLKSYPDMKTHFPELAYATVIAYTYKNSDKGHTIAFIPRYPPDKSLAVEPDIKGSKLVGWVRSLEQFACDERNPRDKFYWPVYKKGAYHNEWQEFNPLDRSTWPLPRGRFTSIKRLMSRLNPLPHIDLDRL